MGNTLTIDPPANLEMPTPRERLAYNLKRRQGLNDSQIADVLGISRETANRCRARFATKLKKLRVACAGSDCTLIESLTA